MQSFGSITRLMDAQWIELTVLARRIAGRVRHVVARRPEPQVQAVAPLAQASEPAASPKRLDLADQWNKLAGVLTTAIEGTCNVREMQAAATQQLDLAQYGITTLIDELTAVMALPGRQPRLATVHALASGSDYASKKAAADRALAA